MSVLNRIIPDGYAYAAKTKEGTEIYSGGYYKGYATVSKSGNGVCFGLKKKDILKIMKKEGTKWRHDKLDENFDYIYD